MVIFCSTICIQNLHRQHVLVKSGCITVQKGFKMFLYDFIALKPQLFLHSYFKVQGYKGCLSRVEEWAALCLGLIIIIFSLKMMHDAENNVLGSTISSYKVDFFCFFFNQTWAMKFFWYQCELPIWRYLNFLKTQKTYLITYLGTYE